MKQKREKLMRALSYADDEYIAEAAPKGKKPKRNAIKLMILAATLGCLLAAFNLWLFIPYDTSLPDVSMYADSPYYEVIQKLNVITYRRPLYKNNFEKLGEEIRALFRFQYKDEASLSSGISSDTYQEITDNQVKGVIEGDLIKRSDRYAYYLGGDRLSVYSIAGKDSKLVSEYCFFATEEKKHSHSARNSEIYLSKDCKTVYFIAQTEENWEPVVALIAVDVSDPENIQEIKRISVSGYYLSSRMTEDCFLIMSDFYVDSWGGFGTESSFVPHITTPDEVVSVAPDAIVAPDVLTSASYTVVCKLDVDTLELEDSFAFLSYSENVYVSKDYVYVTRSYTEDAVKQDFPVTYLLPIFPCCITVKRGYSL